MQVLPAAHGSAPSREPPTSNGLAPGVKHEQQHQPPVQSASTPGSGDSAGHMYAGAPLAAPAQPAGSSVGPSMQVPGWGAQSGATVTSGAGGTRSSATGLQQLSLPEQAQQPGRALAGCGQGDLAAAAGPAQPRGQQQGQGAAEPLLPVQPHAAADSCAGLLPKTGQTAAVQPASEAESGGFPVAEGALAGSLGAGDWHAETSVLSDATAIPGLGVDPT